MKWARVAGRPSTMRALESGRATLAIDLRPFPIKRRTVGCHASPTNASARHNSGVCARVPTGIFHSDALEAINANLRSYRTNCNLSVKLNLEHNRGSKLYLCSTCWLLRTHFWFGACSPLAVQEERSLDVRP